MSLTAIRISWSVIFGTLCVCLWELSLQAYLLHSHHFLIVAAILAYIPWLPWSTRFSLRTLFITTTAAAVGLWFIMLMVKR